VGGLSYLLDRATSRAPMKPADSKSAATFERLVIDGAPYVLKVVDGRSDWLAIASGDSAGRAVCLWEDGVYQSMPASIDHTVVAAERLDADAGWPVALLMHDRSHALVPEDATVSMDTHAAFLGAMADVAVAFRAEQPRTTYMPLLVNYLALGPDEARRQVQQGTSGGPQPFIVPGWEQIRRDMPALYAAVAPLLDDPRPLAGALSAMPSTFLHGDWKMGNLGHGRDGRVVLLDWDRPCVGPPLVDLAWYVAVNCDRLPESKDAVLARYRDCVESRGWDASSWWERETVLALTGAFLQLGWSKAGQDDELAWWEPFAHEARRLLDL
jgi:hypothetical protein